ncbi:valine--tRNA ligase [Tuwongella immobilis]|uniref:Valine--tRNA ligase n=1 Tax=Tuwongella immobilis TaxID=692036 RepID=A0A6C2YSR7_9BACT|nr:valine--tRNA ligase [Tuwongella immobilis]VIP04109.1 valyl-trna synthetase : Valine--tRNA ligase OS=Planctomyces maris DSM 8797 GN=valS PE=3 SV=1: tRNA-synt_1: Anticodon_1: Val_tRNA-synt_C [Tuwongella immobilis]VTS05585.1 valyl-trna synthetase : Valine--tRNA ligase OS=Planctomyces maris DSM 8797 GN=valS PE=3 SV=1: tRNA-synt_1: Anticodon_1: Val_tRNA-synt_C [Tuwongella immobilis]
MSTELPKAYDPREAQSRWLPFWTERGISHAEPSPDQTAYSIVIPPPNVTGALHMGHALNNTIQDVLIRWRRMQGFNAVWIPGTDHAGIATQAVVERLVFNTEKKTRHDLGREALVERIWQWKDKYENRILGQLRELGCSADWQRTRFTLDPICARAVRETFFRMFRDGYIYRGKRLVNWDPHLQTSVADDETYTEDTKGGFWTFKYPVKDQPDTFIRFSTTRPETMLGDTAVCVHPNDPRYQSLIGKLVTIPLNGREIPIIADGQLADPELGTGCVKVTPAHDPNDYLCGLRNQLPMINIMNPDGSINENGGEFAGLDRYKAREAVVAAMDQLGFFEGKEEREIPLKYSDRSKTPIEPYLSDQWFVRMSDREDGKPGLAQLAMDAVTSGQVTFYPERYAKTYLDWLGEKRDWCISRQLWWGHRIPIWYANCTEAQLQQAFAGREDVAWTRNGDGDSWLISSTTDLPMDALGAGIELRQDNDVLDTWFSSALWPHSTFGWPEATPELAYYYPTSTLVTSRDIITLWVARMVMMGLYNLGNIPFRQVYITPKVLDGFGEGMSKSKGNGVDPLDIIERYGADALRYQMMSIAGETQDSRLPVANVCPNCDALVPVKREHLSGRTRKVDCPSCKKSFRPGGPWTSDDPDYPTAKQASEVFEIGRNFANKLWNASRFILMNLEGYTPQPLDANTLPIEDRWILSRLATAVDTVTEQLDGFRFNEVSRTLYDFVWTEFCDWYIELSKNRLRDESTKAGVQAVLVGVLDAIVRLVQPVMPFLAETIWHAMNERVPQRGLFGVTPPTESVVVAAWPTLPAGTRDAAIELRFARMQELIRAVREVRNRYMVDNRRQLDAVVRCSESIAADFDALAPFIISLGGLGTLTAAPTVSKPPQAAAQVTPEFELYISLVGLIDVAAEIVRTEKQLGEKRKQLSGIEGRLNNAGFVSRAAPEVVQAQREQVVEIQKQIALLEETLAGLKSSE